MRQPVWVPEGSGGGKQQRMHKEGKVGAPKVWELLARTAGTGRQAIVAGATASACRLAGAAPARLCHLPCHHLYQGFGGSVVPVVDGVPARVKRRTCQPDPFQQVGGWVLGGWLGRWVDGWVAG